MEEKTFEIDIRRLLFELLNKAWIIILAAAVMATVSYLYTTTQPEMYTASASLYVNNYSLLSNDKGQQKVSNSDLLTSQALVRTYSTLLTSNPVLDKVTEMLDYDYTNGQIKNMISSSSVNDTEVFMVKIMHTDPYEAKRIADAVIDVAPIVIMEYIEGSSAKVVDYAQVPTKRSSPNYTRAIVLGGFLGGGLAAVIIALMFLFNSKISSEEDIVKLFSAPLIGQIPDFSQFERANNYTQNPKKKHKKGGGDR